MIKLIGGAGFVGSRLIEIQEDCFVLDKRCSGDEYVDITDPRSLHGKISKHDKVVLLAAEHRDDVMPTSKYYETNVEGTKNVLNEMDRIGCKNLIFTSSVAVYGLGNDNPDEIFDVNPFNHYGESKLAAENVIKAWYEKDCNNKCVTIIRPTVIFGENNRGNVHNLLKQIASGKFLMIGKGENEKSMAYVGNIVSFIASRLNADEGFHIFNYADKPDFRMNSLLYFIEKTLGKSAPSIRIPVWLGYLTGYSFDILARLTRLKFPISAVRVKKFVANTKFDSTKSLSSGFKPPYTIEEGLERTLTYEFLQKRKTSRDASNLEE